MSGSVGLTINTGADWAVQIAWTDSVGNPVPLTNPTMDIRQELSPTGTKIAQLDTTGTLDGKITIQSDGSLLLQIPAATTKTLLTGNGFWDLFVTTNGARVRMLFGTIAITPHTTAVS